jgi:hypothetical protein
VRGFGDLFHRKSPSGEILANCLAFCTHMHGCKAPKGIRL